MHVEITKFEYHLTWYFSKPLHTSLGRYEHLLIAPSKDMAVGTSVQLFAYHWTIQCVGVGPLCQSPTLLQVTVETSHFSVSVKPTGERRTIC